MRRWPIAWTMASLVVGGSAWSQESGTARVVATTAIVADWVSQVGGDGLSVLSLVSDRSDPHAFRPTPRDIWRIGEADLVVAHGLGLEPWLERAVRSAGAGDRVLQLSDAVDPVLLEPEDAAHHEHPDHGHGHGDRGEGAHNGVPDPHTWLDVRRAITMVSVLAERLETVLPEEAPEIRERARRYTTQLEQLDAELVAAFSEIPTRRRILVTRHGSFHTFAARYGFSTPVTLLGTLTTDAADPSASGLSRKIERIRRLGAPVLFAEFPTESRLLDLVAREVGVPVSVLYTATFDPDDAGVVDYVTMMRANLVAIRESLSVR